MSKDNQKAKLKILSGIDHLCKTDENYTEEATEGIAILLRALNEIRFEIEQENLKWEANHDQT